MAGSNRLQDAVAKGAELPGVVKVNEGAPDADPRIATPTEPIKKAPKYRTTGNKVVTPTHTRPPEWYERHGFKKA